MAEDIKLPPILFHGEVQLLDWGETRASGKFVKLRLPEHDGDPLEAFRGLDTATKARSGHILHVTVAEGDIAEAAAEQAGTDKPRGKGPHGVYAQALHRSGFFGHQAVLSALGTDEDYLAWVRRQPCARTGSDNGVVAAHVRRAGHAGTGFKPTYSAIPLHDDLHRLQHQQGESAVADTGWWDRQAYEHAKRWACERLRDEFGVDSLTWIDPRGLRDWAMARGVIRHLPAQFQEVA